MTKTLSSFLVTLSFAIGMLNTSWASEYDRMLDQYEEIIVEYEWIANKDPICLEDSMYLISVVTPKLTEMSATIETIDYDADFPESSLQRYLALTERFQAALMTYSETAMQASDC